MATMEQMQREIAEKAQKRINDSRKVATISPSDDNSVQVMKMLEQILHRLDNLGSVPSVPSKTKVEVKPRTERVFIPSIDSSSMSINAEKPEIRKSKLSLDDVAKNVEQIEKMSGESDGNK